jgi:hypothetical protein
VPPPPNASTFSNRLREVFECEGEAYEKWVWNKQIYLLMLSQEMLIL